MRRLDRWSKIGATLEEIKNRKTKKKQRIFIFCISGTLIALVEEMDKDLKNRINRLRENRNILTSFYEIDFQRIAVTKEQIKNMICRKM